MAARRGRIHDGIPVYVAGIPALAGIVYSVKVEGSYSYNAPSDLDYYGYSDIEFRLHDRKGYFAPWLEAKADALDLWGDLEAQVEDYMDNDRF